VVLPFLLGLKFKATALVPLALSLIALKTWKALTLGLLSLVLSGAMVIFRFTKPKVRINLTTNQGLMDKKPTANQSPEFTGLIDPSS